jgi:hypothetical protein
MIGSSTSWRSAGELGLGALEAELGSADAVTSFVDTADYYWVRATSKILNPTFAQRTSLASPFGY